MDAISTSTADERFAPTDRAARIASLDAVRGVAVLGILTMNVVAFGLGDASYFNISASSPQAALDWVIAGFGEIFFDQKFMALFSMLFGAGIVLFSDRVAANGGRPVALTLWRNLLLLLIGIGHAMVWDGDVLVIYAVCAPVVLMLRRLSIRWLFIAGGIATLGPPVLAVFVQASLPESGTGLGSYWGVAGSMSDAVGIWLTVDIWFRAFGAMLIGMALYRTGFLTGDASFDTYRRTTVWGLALGVPLAGLGVAFVALNDFAPSAALVSTVPNALATIPMAVAYAAIIIVAHRSYTDRPLDMRIRDVGRMALTNYLAQTALAVIVLQGLLGDISLTRTSLALFVVAASALQLWWSHAWMSRFRFGPAEWVWRAATYRRIP